MVLAFFCLARSAVCFWKPCLYCKQRHICLRLSSSFSYCLSNARNMDTSLVTSAITVPSGHVFVNKKWRGSDLGSLFTRNNNFIYSDGMGFIDFYASETCPVIYVTESDILLNNVHARKLKQMAEVYRSRGVVVTKRDEHFADVQDLASVELGMMTIPIANQEELPRLLTQLAYAESRSNNPFRSSNNSSDAMCLATQVSLLSNISNVGETGAKKLLSEYGHIGGVAVATMTALKKLVGQCAAKEIVSFFKDESSIS